MNHKITLWPSIAAVLIWLVPFFASHCEKKVPPPVKLKLFDEFKPIPSLPFPLEPLIIPNSANITSRD